MSLDTVNRTLLTFQRLGLARAVEFSGEPRRFDTDVRPHHHFRCIQCGRIIDFYHEGYDALEVPDTLKNTLTILEKRVCLEGICDQCRS